MQQSLSFRPALIFFILFSVVFSRPFDWQYNNISVPFAVFYNPALLGNVPGSTFGIDVKYADSADYDVRGALIIPVGRVLRREDHSSMNYSRHRYFGYPNTSYRSSRTAVSVGGIYAGEDNYQLSAGFTAPMRFVQPGASFDLTYRGGDPAMSFNAGIGANIPSLVGGSGMLYVVTQNLVTNDVDAAGRFKLTFGTSGMTTSRPDVYSIPYDFFFSLHFGRGSVQTTEGTARLSIDLTRANTVSGTVGQSAAATVGYSFLRERSGSVDNRFFINVGIVFINKKSAASLMGSYGSKDEMFGAFTYSLLKKDVIQTDKDIHAGLTHTIDDDSSVIFGLLSVGTTITSWVLKIEDPSGANIRTYSGGNAVPSSILWDGTDSEGVKVEEEILYAKLVLKGHNRVVETKAITIEWRAP